MHTYLCIATTHGHGHGQLHIMNMFVSHNTHAISTAIVCHYYALAHFRVVGHSAAGQCGEAQRSGDNDHPSQQVYCRTPAYRPTIMTDEKRELRMGTNALMNGNETAMIRHRMLRYGKWDQV
jgi:hypothetical protein